MIWDTKFEFYWYNDNEIFSYSDMDFDAQAKKMAQTGINVIITFSSTHFRWSFRPYWDIINQCIGKMVKACHKYGIKVVEHHSSHLTFDPLCSDDWDYMERSLNKRQSSIDSWKGIRDNIADDPLINGKPVSSFRQIDGRTGRWARSNYNGYAMCFNNEDYRRAYFEYLESVYKTGVDGIMTDDVQWFADGNACACECCRKLFSEKTGYELPQPGEAWHKFYGNYDDPVFVSWEKFKRSSAAEFQYAVNRHFKSLGLDLMRPNYVSSILLNNSTGYPLEAVADLWDYIFQENCFSDIIRYSWPAFAMEAVHRYALAERNGVPSMSMFYPDRADSFYFSWALSQSWGQMLLVTQEGVDLGSLEKKLRDFEKAHGDLLYDQKKQADIAFYFSTKTRDYIKDARDNEMPTLVSWMQAAYFSNISIDMVFETDDLEKLKRYPVIVLPCVSMLNDDEIDNLKVYAEKGGTLLILGRSGERNEKGAIRSLDNIAGRFGMESRPYKLEDCSSEECVLSVGDGKIKVGQVRCEYVFNVAACENIAMTSESGKTAGIIASKGKGCIIWLINPFGSAKYHKEVHANRWYKNEIRIDLPQYAVDYLKENAGAALDMVLAHRLLDIDNCPDGLIATCYKNKSNTKNMIHLVNTRDTLPKEICRVGHSDTIPAFAENSAISPMDAFTLSLRNNCKNTVDCVRLYTPLNGRIIMPGYKESAGRITIEIPHGCFGDYALVEVSFKAGK